MQEKPSLIYLANACGEETGHGEFDKSLLDKIAFESGPGALIVYLVEVDGKPALLGNLDVAYQDESWGTTVSQQMKHGFPTFEEAQVIVKEIVRDMLGNIAGTQLDGRGVRVFPVKEDLSDMDHEPGRLNVICTIPMDLIPSREAGQAFLAHVFGEHHLLSMDEKPLTGTVCTNVSTMWEGLVSTRSLVLPADSAPGRLLIDRLNANEQSYLQHNSGEPQEQIAAAAEAFSEAYELI